MIDLRVGRDDCSATVTYREPQVGKPYYTAVCSCGWLGLAQRSERRAAAEARAHTDTVTIRLEPSEEDSPLLSW